MMEARLIDLNDYERFGEGANGVSYNHKADPGRMMKLYNAGAPMSNIINEWNFAHMVYDAGIPTPRPGDLVTDGERFGMEFERTSGKKSFSRASGDDPEHVAEYAQRFAAMCRKLHSTEVDTGKFRNIKDVYLELLAGNPYFKPGEKEKVAEFIKATPDACTAIHGDLQFSNAIFVGEKEYFIDLGDFSYGNPLFDLGMVLLTCIYDDEAFIKEFFHMSKDTAREFWEAFVPAYFGDGMSPDEAEALLRPYAGLKVLIIERDSQMYFPNFHALLDGITG